MPSIRTSRRLLQFAFGPLLLLGCAETCTPIASEGQLPADAGLEALAPAQSSRVDGGQSPVAAADAGNNPTDDLTSDAGPGGLELADAGEGPSGSSPLTALQGTWTGTLSCYEEGLSSSGTAVLALALDGLAAGGTVTFTGTTPVAFTTTANLQLVVASDGSLEGVWSDCAINGNELDDGTDGSVSCHFWHESDYFKPNDFEISADGETLSILEKPGIDSEAQKCQGDLSKQ